MTIFPHSVKWVILLGLLLWLSVFWSSHLLKATLFVESSNDAVLLIKRGSSLRTVINELSRVVDIEHPLLLRGILKILGYENKLKYGEYSIRANDSVYSVVHKMVVGETVTRQFTLLPGMTNYQVIRKLLSEAALMGEVSSDDLAEKCLFPETYNFNHGDSRLSIVQTMHLTCEKEFNKVWDSSTNNLPLKSLNDAIILASIVEKESGKNDDMARVAAIFLNRLKVGMKLQSDVTVIYVLSGYTGIFDNRPLTINDTKTVSPYNTYYIDGLPPAPICHPSLNALIAVLNPLQTKELYFIADDQGKLYYSNDFDGHADNRRRVSNKKS